MYARVHTVSCSVITSQTSSIWRFIYPKIAELATSTTCYHFPPCESVETTLKLGGGKLRSSRDINFPTTKSVEILHFHFGISFLQQSCFQFARPDGHQLDRMISVELRISSRESTSSCQGKNGSSYPRRALKLYRSRLQSEQITKGHSLRLSKR